ncbi:hypothetical protein SCA6_018529 [Theobroma cacao]
MELPIFEPHTIARAADSFSVDIKVREGGFGTVYKNLVRLLGWCIHRNGYMSPEYAIDGLFSAKSTVFSSGILLLEILSGKKDRGLYHPTQSANLVEHALIPVV